MKTFWWPWNVPWHAVQRRWLTLGILEQRAHSLGFELGSSKNGQACQAATSSALISPINHNKHRPESRFTCQHLTSIDRAGRSSEFIPLLGLPNGLLRNRSSRTDHAASLKRGLARWRHSPRHARSHERAVPLPAGGLIPPSLEWCFIETCLRSHGSKCSQTLHRRALRGSRFRVHIVG